MNEEARFLRLRKRPFAGLVPDAHVETQSVGPLSFPEKVLVVDTIYMCQGPRRRRVLVRQKQVSRPMSKRSVSDVFHFLGGKMSC